jgi:putative transposase
MPRLTPVPIDIASEERRKLETLARAHSTPQQLAERARIILLAADTVGVHETARRLGIWPKTVRRWRARWLGSTSAVDIGARLADVPRPGVKPKFTAEQICAIVALACEPPEATGVPITHWSQSELARQAVARGIVPEISHNSVGRFLKRI